MNQDKYNRILGLFFGQIVGDALGTRYEFCKKQDAQNKLMMDIENNNGKLEILGDGPFGVQPGQYTDDSELALGIWYSLLMREKYDIDDIVQQFYKWYKSNPFDIGNATRQAFCRGSTREDMVENAQTDNMYSISNGCLMKISPLGCINHLFDSHYDLQTLSKEICELTNPNSVCIDMCICYVEAINVAIETGSPIQTYLRARDVAKTKIVKLILEDAKTRTVPVKCMDSSGEIFEISADNTKQGYAGIAFQNAFYHLLNTPKHYNKQNGYNKMMIQIISLGGDTDTNCCIAGALYCACNGFEYIKSDFIAQILSFDNDIKRKLIYPPLNHKHIYELLVQKMCKN